MYVGLGARGRNDHNLSAFAFSELLSVRSMENKEKAADSAPQQNGHATEEDEKEQPARELTQTDRINRSLLNSFLQRLDDPSLASQFPKVDRINTDEPDPPEERDDEKNDDCYSTSEPTTDR